jgi:hypothetical protein
MANPRNHDEFWFSDGNIVLHADGIGFKVYRGVLARHSVIFANMFDDAQPGEDELLGIPVVPLFDSAQDVEVLLGELFGHGGCAFFSSAHSDDGF